MNKTDKANKGTYIRNNTRWILVPAEREATGIYQLKATPIIHGGVLKVTSNRIRNQHETIGNPNTCQAENDNL